MIHGTGSSDPKCTGRETPSTSSIAESLSDASVHSTLMKIFKTKSSTSASQEAPKFNPSAIPGKLVHSQKKSLKLSRRLLSIQAYNIVKSRCFFHVNII